MQEAEEGAARVFAARRSLRGLWLFVVSSLLLAGFGAVFFGIGEPLGAWIIGVSLFLGCLIVLQALRPGWRYTVGPEGIGIRRFPRVQTIRREEIASVEVIDGIRVGQILAGPQWAVSRAGPGMNLLGAVRARREIDRIIAFSSARIVLTRVRTGGSPEPRDLGVIARGRFVLVTLSSDAVRILSPRDVDGFVQAWQDRAR